LQMRRWPSPVFWDTKSCKNSFHVTSARITHWRF
jgi:hypothetical protein